MREFDTLCESFKGGEILLVLYGSIMSDQYLVIEAVSGTGDKTKTIDREKVRKDESVDWAAKRLLKRMRKDSVL